MSWIIRSSEMDFRLMAYQRTHAKDALQECQTLSGEDEGATFEGSHP